jgi:PAS domain S-box-containing protein
MTSRSKKMRGEAAFASDDFLIGDGPLVDLIRSKDWSHTPLGTIDEWPQSLRTTVSLCLASNFPINIIWGPDHVQLYNDGYRVVCGDAHPSAMGESYRVTWASAWPAIGEPFERALAGTTSFIENQRMFLTRNGYLEETFFTFSLSPIRDESGGIGGLFHPVTETTATMLSERRTRGLRDLTAGLSAAKDVSELISLTIDTLARFQFDLPFLLAYQQTPERRHYRLAGQTGCRDMAGVLPEVIERGAATPWPVAEALRLRRIIDAPATMSLQGGQCGPYDEAPSRVFVLPIGLPGVDETPVMLIAGVSPRLPLDDAYRGFFELLHAAVAAALATVRAREDERRRAEALAEIDRAKTTFFSNISHEFRTPLTLMLGPLEECLARSEDLPADAVARVELAHRNGQRLLKLVNTLLEFSRIEAGRMQATYEATDLSAFTAELASNFRSATERAGLQLVIDAPSLPQLVHVDRDMWEKVMLNLLSNAFKFTFEGSITVVVRPSADGQAAQVQVSDTGTGVAAAELPRLFERFHRVEGAKGRSFEGSGIGLALVLELVKLHGGEITAASELGKGTTFTITIPFGTRHLQSEWIRHGAGQAGTRGHAAQFVCEAISWLPERREDDRPQRPAPPVVQSAGGHILLADDNSDMRAYLERILLDQGFSVESVANGEAALEAAARRPPDLVLSDVMMPRLDGFGLLEQFRKHPEFKGTPFILVSARAGAEAREEGLGGGADDYLTKPFSRRELVARVSANLNLARTRRESALRASEALLRELNAELEQKVIERSLARGRTWDLSLELMSVINEHGLIENSNPAWMNVLGWPEAQITGKPLLHFLHPEDVAAAQASFAGALAHRQPEFGLEARFRTQDGGYRWLSWVAIPEDARVYFSARDITAEKEREAELAEVQASLRQSQKMEAVGQLTGGLAHDFNNLLTGITGSLEMLQSRIAQGRLTDVDRYVVAAQGAARRAAALTHRLLAFSRRQTLEPKSIHVNRLVWGMTDLIQRTIGPEIAFETRCAADLWNTLVDQSQLENAVLNLCINARDAMPDGGTLTLETANCSLDERAARGRDITPGQYVSLCVSDNGTGMTPEVMAKAFDPFFTTKPIGSGTGLGLSMIYGFARQSGGEIRMYSELGKGTTVCIYLPRHLGPAEVADRMDASAQAVSAPQNETVLVVDDEPTVRMLVVDVLEEAGYTAIDAGDGFAGLKVLNSNARIDLLVSDVGLPGGMNGRQLADAARQKRPDLKVLFITGYAEKAVLSHGQLDPGMHVLTKPFTMDALAHRVRTLIDESRA